MLQYLINTTSIWLLSLLAFELFLKKQTDHSYSRLYLLGTFLIGIFLPLVQWQQEVFISSTDAPLPRLAAVSEIKHAVETSQPAQAALSFNDGLLLVYLTGVAICTLLLFKELMMLVALYRGGTRQRTMGIRLVETGKDHGPFSAFGIIFIHSQSNYTDEQLRIILEHEKQHVQLFHFADLLLVQVAKLVFWFHPLVYRYNHRLMLVHEYQADRTAGKYNTAHYGHFLLEQSMLSGAPHLSHSFHHSPIKNRIAMLTKKTSSPIAKWLTPVPLVIIFLLCFSKNSFSDDRKQLKGNILTYKGNVFEMSIPPTDTIIVTDPVTGKFVTTLVKREPYPVKLNGEILYSYNSITTSPLPENTTQDLLKEEIAHRIQEHLARLEDGIYHFSIGDLILNKKGKLVYFSKPQIFSRDYKKIDDKTKAIFSDIIQKIAQTYNELPPFTPALKDGQPVPFYFSGSLPDPSKFYQSDSGPLDGPFKYKVENHKVTYLP